MTGSLIALICAAAGIGFVHTVAGPDHYLPFAALATARKWSKTKTLWVTLLCGLGHVLSSVVLGLIGLGTGLALTRLVHVEGVRGDLAAWLLIVFGLVYLVWGWVQGVRNQPHEHYHPSESQSLTPWALFIVFVFGPCEPLIPLLMYPAAQSAWWGVGVVALVFGIVTLLTMCGMVFALSFGFKLFQCARWVRFQHALAGGAVLACGVAVLCGL